MKAIAIIILLTAAIAACVSTPAQKLDCTWEPGFTGCSSISQ
jgi:hypothetical protein